MTRQQIRDIARKRLGETTAAFWQDTELNLWINNAGHDLAWMTKCIRKKGFMTPTEDTGEYTLSALFPTLLAIREVYYYQEAQNWMKLNPTNTEDLNVTNSGWRNAESGTPYMFYWDREEDLFGLYVPPDATNAGDSYCRIHYCDDFTEPASDSAAITGIPDGLQLAMIDFVVATGLETRGHIDRAQVQWKMYLDRIRNYQSVTNAERDETDEDIVMKNYRNI